MGKELPNRKPQRLKEFDYSNSAYYFVTICVKNWKTCFGKVDNNIILNKYGVIVDEICSNLPAHFNIELDEYIIMPNHFHGIIIISEDSQHSLSTIIGSFKSFVSRKVKKTKPDFAWQKSFYDRIIRNEKELYQIRKYIRQNPLKWEYEKKTPGNLEI